MSPSMLVVLLLTCVGPGGNECVSECTLVDEVFWGMWDTISSNFVILISSLMSLLFMSSCSSTTSSLPRMRFEAKSLHIFSWFSSVLLSLLFDRQMYCKQSATMVTPACVHSHAGFTMLACGPWAWTIKRITPMPRPKHMKSGFSFPHLRLT